MTQTADARRNWILATLISCALSLTGCGPGQSEYPERTGDSGDIGGSTSATRSGGVSASSAGLFGGGDADSEGGIGVNGFLWRASLDTIAFMPLASADPFGGVIITDWYAAPETPGERFKMTVYILDKRLRADGLRVSVFRQTRNDADWQDSEVSPGVATRLENAILTRARQLRIDTIEE
jgi:hypothetical protein